MSALVYRANPLDTKELRECRVKFPVHLTGRNLQKKSNVIFAY